MGTWTKSLGNTVKTGLLLAALSALVLGVGQALGGGGGLAVALVVVLLMNGVSYWFSDRLALAMHGARRLEPGELPWLVRMNSELAARAGIPAPALYLIEDRTPNAFATGRDPAHAAVAFTTGLLALLDRREVEGVLAHELAHVRHRDTLIMTVAATLSGVITHLAQTAFWWGGAFLSRDDDREEGGLSSGLATLGVLVVAPLTATLLQLAISRAREFEADEAAARLTSDPRGLASALSRLEQGNRLAPSDASPATAHLFIVSPLSGHAVMQLFATHPPISARIDRLLELEAVGARAR